MLQLMYATHRRLGRYDNARGNGVCEPRCSVICIRAALRMPRNIRLSYKSVSNSGGATSLVKQNE
eukprot:4240433-Pyramimonas_sp.AAC.1